MHYIYIYIYREIDRCMYTYMQCIHIYIYIYIYICTHIYTHANDLGSWRDAVHGARWGNGVPRSSQDTCWLLSSLLSDISSRKTLRPALAEKSKNHRDTLMPSGWYGPLRMSLTALP